METEVISDLSDCILALAHGVDSGIIPQEKAFEVANVVLSKIEKKLEEV